MLAINDKFEAVPEVASMESFKLMARVFNERSDIVSEEKPEVTVKTQEDLVSTLSTNFDGDLTTDEDVDSKANDDAFMEAVSDLVVNMGETVPTAPEAAAEAAAGSSETTGRLVAMLKEPKESSRDSVQSA
jgi:hypothetical protein